MSDCDAFARLLAETKPEWLRAQPELDRADTHEARALRATEYARIAHALKKLAASECDDVDDEEY